MDTAIIGQDDVRPGVTVVTTHAASADELTDQDYRDIYDELRDKASLDKFVALLNAAAAKPTVSKAWWSKFERGEAELTHERRNELRAAVGLPRLPETVTAVTAAIDPDATVYQVGGGAPDRVIMVGGEAHEPLTMRLNGRLRILAEDAPENVTVTGVTTSRRARSTKSLSVSRPTWERASAGRQARGLTWDAYVARAEVVDDLVAALKLVELYLDVDEDVMEDPATWGEYERLSSKVRKALNAVRNGEQR